jgi:hypothetical protein
MFIQLLTEQSSYLTVRGNQVDRSEITAGAFATFQVYPALMNQPLPEGEFVHGQEVILQQTVGSNILQPDWGHTSLTVGPSDVGQKHIFRRAENRMKLGA